MLLLTQSPIVWLLVLTALIGGYLSGSVPYGLILTRLAGIGDIRKVGSGNIGATNVLRAGGKKLAIITLLLDGLKGYIPVVVAKHYGMDYAVMAALGAFLGHLFPVWLKFKGGKGVATGLGVCFGLSGLLGLSLVATWLLVAGFTHYSSLAALTAFGLSPLLAGIIVEDMQVTSTAFIIAVLVWIRHKDNIKRIANDTEGKINLGGNK